VHNRVVEVVIEVAHVRRRSHYTEGVSGFGLWVFENSAHQVFGLTSNNFIERIAGQNAACIVVLKNHGVSKPNDSILGVCMWDYFAANADLDLHLS
jgi:hypothetical protein